MKYYLIKKSEEFNPLDIQCGVMSIKECDMVELTEDELKAISLALDTHQHSKKLLVAVKPGEIYEANTNEIAIKIRKALYENKNS